MAFTNSIWSSYLANKCYFIRFDGMQVLQNKHIPYGEFNISNNSFNMMSFNCSEKSLEYKTNIQLLEELVCTDKSVQADKKWKERHRL